MNALPDNEAAGPPPQDLDKQTTYTLELVAEITGISSQTILTYQELGLIQAAETTGDFGEDAVYTLRRIEHLRSTSEANLSGIKLILDLMEEVDRLKAALRAHR